MKTTLFLWIPFLFSGIVTQAQPHQVQAITFEEFIAQKERQKVQREEHSPLAMVQRCTSTATYTNQTFSDSTRLTYTHPRGSFNAKNAFNVGSAPDTIFRIALNSGQASVKEINEYDAANRHISSEYFMYGQQVGTASSQYNSSGTLLQDERDYDDGTSLKLYQKTIYNSEGLRVFDTTYQNTYGQQNSMNYFVTDQYDYDAQNRVREHASHMAFNNYTFVVKEVTRHYYAGNSTQPFLDSIFNYLSNGSILKSAKHFYYHPDGRNLSDTTFSATGSPSATSQYTYNGTAVTMIQRSNSGGNWQNTARTLSQNNNDGNSLYLRNFYWHTGTNSWTLNTEDSIFYNAAGYMMRTHSLNTSNPDNTLKTVRQNIMERNSYNNTYKWTAKSYTDGALSDETTNFYYFEDYDNGLSLKPVSQKIKASIYPNPAMATLKVHIDDPKAAHLMISICDLTGKHLSGFTQIHSENTLDINHLPAGQFILTIQDKGGNRLFSQKFSKQ